MAKKSIWSEIRNDYQDDNNLYIDAWMSGDDNENGSVIAIIDLDTLEVNYKDQRAKKDNYAQEMINMIILN